MPNLPRFPPDPEEIEDRLLSIIRPPVPPWVWLKAKREQEVADPFRKHRERKPRTGMGRRVHWPYVIEWAESTSGRGQIKVLRDLKPIGTVSYLDRGERDQLSHLLEDIIRGG